MAPKGKSSATAGTRKKQAKKAAQKAGVELPVKSGQPLQRGQKKDKKAPKVKQYIPPPPPPRGEPDPVDRLGLGRGDSAVAAERVVTLRKVAKRDAVTVERGVEEWEEWARSTMAAGGGVEELVETLPAWTHHFPRLATHPSRRVRLLTATLHSALLANADCRPHLVAPAELEREDYVGGWLISAFDADRMVRQTALAAWKGVFESGDDELSVERYTPELLHHLGRLVLPSDGSDTPDPALGTRKTNAMDEPPALTRSRLRAAAFEALAYLLRTHRRPTEQRDPSFEDYLGDEELWTALDPAVEEEPGVRRALWALLEALSKLPDLLDVSLIARHVLPNAFIELDQGAHLAIVAALSPLLPRHPELWTLPDRSEDTDDDETREQTPSTIQRFLTFLTLGCSGNPIAFYPALCLFVSSLAQSGTPLQTFLPSFSNSLWAAVDGRALQLSGARGVQRFVLGWHATVVWAGGVLEGGATEWIRAETERMTEALLSSADAGRTWRSAFAVAELPLSAVLAKDWGLKDAVWEVMGQSVAAERTAIDQGRDPARLVKLLDLLQKPTDDESKTRARTTVTAVLDWAVDRLAANPRPAHAAVIAHVLPSAPDEAVNTLAKGSLPRLLLSDPDPAFKQLAVLILNKDAGEGPAELWRRLTARDALTDPASWSFLVALVQDRGSRIADLPNADLGDVFLAALDRALEPTDEKGGGGDTLARMLQTPHPFISAATAHQAIERVASRLTTLTNSVLSAERLSTPTVVALGATMATVRSLATTATLTTSKVAADCFLLSQLLPRRAEVVDETLDGVANVACADAFVSFNMLVRTVSADDVLEGAVADLRRALLDPASPAHPIDLATAARTLLQRLNLEDVGPALVPLDLCEYRRAAIEAHTAPSSLAILDSIVVAAESVPTTSAEARVYLRLVLALFDSIAQDRSRASIDHLQDALHVSQACRDALAVEGMPSWCASLKRAEAEALASIADSTATYLVARSKVPADWHTKTAAAVRTGDGDHPLSRIVVRLARGDGINPARCLRALLELIFRYAEPSQSEAERWLALAQTQDTPVALAIVLAAKDYLLDSPRFERYQNELASSLSGVSAAAANARGLSLLRLLCAVAPPEDSPHIFLPQQRAIFLLQNLQRWNASDEDLDDQVHASIAELMSHLVPIVQDLGGSHWDFMFDVVESNFEVATWDDATTLLPLWRSAILLATLKQFSLANGTLREVTRPRITRALPLLQSLFIARPISGRQDAPSDAIADLMIDLLKDLPPSSMSMEGSFAELVALQGSPSFRARPPAFAMASALVTEHVEKQVVEAELDPEKDPAGLPTSLLDLVRDSQGTSALLGWLLILRFYENASFRLRTAYNAQLRNSGLVESRLLPSLFELLGVSDRGRPFDVSMWSFDELDVSLLDDDSAESQRLLAAHTFFKALRSLPAHIRFWWDECRNKQLSMAVQSFTSRHFSPLLIARELDRVRDPKTLAALKDDSLNVRVSANEVKAIYTVDEQTMEVSIRLPSEYPLETVEVVDVRKVGVGEAQWRAWLLAAQQTITTQGGSVVEALNLFKRNVSLHFEGVEACAICYSIISVTDRSLPTKACRTCHNKFHPSCLFKWFSTSQGSSCPLCRSLF